MPPPVSNGGVGEARGVTGAGAEASVTVAACLGVVALATLAGVDGRRRGGGGPMTRALEGEGSGATARGVVGVVGVASEA